MKLDPYKETIDKWLSDDLKVKRKQRHTARRVYDRLAETNEGSSCSYRTVASYVKRKKKDIYGKTDAALPLLHRPGEAQVDFDSAEFWERGTHYCGKYLNACFPSSNTGYMQLFKGENTECFFEGLRNIFEFLGGVPQRLWFDNASVMVESIGEKGVRGLTKAFLRFKQHYGFEAAFCNPASGNEKGGVENKVGYNRRNLLVPVPNFDDLKEYNKTLLVKCIKDHGRGHCRFNETTTHLHKKDKGKLLPLPSVAFDCARYEAHCIKISNLWYSILVTFGHNKNLGS